MSREKIGDWRATENNFPEDRKGVDYWVAVGEGRYPFQITSEGRNASKRRGKHPDVYVIQMIDRKTGDLKTRVELWGDIQRGIAWYEERK